MFPRSYVFNFLLLAGLAVAGFGANQPSSPPDYTGLYDFDTVAGSPIAGLRNNDAYYEPGQLERVAYQSPGAIVSYQSGFFIADTGNGVLRLVDSYSSRYLLSAYELTRTIQFPDTLRFSQPSGLALTADRVLYFTETGANRIHRYILPTDFTPGRISLFAGGGKAGHVNGTGGATRFNAPTALAVDQAGNVFVADTGNHVIRKISRGGVVTTLAGFPGKPGFADGNNISARFSSPRGIASDLAGNVYVADTGNQVIRVIRPSGSVSTLAGLAATSGSSDGIGSAARFSSPRGLRVRADGKLVVADTGNHTLRLVSAQGEVETLAGTAGLAGRTDGPAQSATFSSPTDLTLSPDGTIFVTDTGNHRIRALSPSRIVSTQSGLRGGAGFVDGTKAVSRLDRPTAFTKAEDGLYFTDFGNQALRCLSWNDDTITTVAELSITEDGGLAASPDAKTAYLSDPSRHTLRLIDIDTGEAAPLAGGADTPGSTDGPAALATFNAPRGLAVSLAGKVYIADSANHTVRRYDPVSGIVDTVAGLAGQAGATNGSATTAAKLRSPWALAFGPDGTLYILERDSGSIRTLSADGAVGTRYLDTRKRLDKPTTLAVDGDGNIIVGDSRNRLFILPRAGTLGILIDEKLGLGSEDDWLARYQNNLPVKTARINHPRALAFGPGDTLYIADTGNSLIRRGRPPLYREAASDVSYLNEWARERLLAAPVAPTYSLENHSDAVGVFFYPRADRRYLQLSRTGYIAPGVYPLKVRAELHDYARIRSLDLHVLPSNQTISLQPAYFTYDGTPKIPAIIAAEGLTVTSVLYDGSPTPPVSGGKHTVRVSYSSNGASASQDLDLWINQADYPRFSIPAGPFTADGQPFNPLAGQPFGEAGTWSLISGPAKIENNLVVLLSAGEVKLSYQLPNTPDYCITSISGTIQATASNTLVPAAVTLDGLETTYDGEAKPVTATTEPPGLDVLVRYIPPAWLDPVTQLPLRAGEYEVEALVTTPGYSGYTRATQKIAKATATLVAAPLAPFVYDHQPYRPVITTVPAGVGVKIRLDGNYHADWSSISPGTHSVSVELSDYNYEPLAPVVFTQTVLKRPVVIQPLPAHRPVGALNPPIVFSYDGLLEGSTPPTLPDPLIDAGPESPPGIYAVKPILPAKGLLTFKSYYDITLLDGTLEVHGYAGTYQTLLLSESTGLPEALLTLKLAGPTGVFSGTLSYRDELFPVKGRFAYAAEPAAAGTSTAYWKIRYDMAGQRDRERLRLQLTLGETLQARLISYEEKQRIPVSNQPLVHASEAGLSPLLDATGNPAVAFAGRHTLLLRGATYLNTYGDPEPPRAPAPVGPGYATGEIDARGLLSLRGTLGDGRPFTGTLTPDTTFNYRLFINPYKRSGSHLAGWLPLRPHPTLSGRRYLPAANDQEIYWTKRASYKDEAYKNGFDLLTLSASLDPWLFSAEEFSAVTSLSLPAAIPSQTATLSTEPLDIDRTTGLFRMQATLHDSELANSLGVPAPATRPLTIKGVLRQPPPDDDVVGAGLLILPPPGAKIDEAFTGELLLSK